VHRSVARLVPRTHCTLQLLVPLRLQEALLLLHFLRHSQSATGTPVMYVIELTGVQAQQQHSVSSNSRSNDLRIGRIQRQKVRISRSRILDSAKKVMQLYGKSKSILEVEYFNEVGTGLGPTLEFYTLVSRELQRTNLYIWRDPKHPHPPSTTAATDTKAPADNDKEEYVNNPGSLFPLPIQPDADSTDAKRKREELWSFIGTFVAKALLDNRLLDLPLSIPFLKWMLGKPLTFHDLSIIDPELHASLHKLVQLCHLKRQILADHSLVLHSCHSLSHVTNTALSHRKRNSRRSARSNWAM
jgi:E3 ubiquitin-protein ligase TRIP12